MNKRQIYWVITNLTGKNPEYVAKNGDPKGRLILNMPDLSDVPEEDFYGKGPKLIEPGRAQTLDVLANFLNPKFIHPEYEPSYFLYQYRRRKEKR